MSILNVTNENFKTEVINSDKPVIVDFWAEWCVPCRTIAPIVEEIAKENNNIKVVKANVDECGELAMTYGVMSIPTLILFKNGKPSGQIIGLQSKDAIMNMIKNNISL